MSCVPLLDLSAPTASHLPMQCTRALRLLRIGYALTLLASLGAFVIRASVQPVTELTQAAPSPVIDGALPALATSLR
jgi:hypothetical protein